MYLTRFLLALFSFSNLIFPNIDIAKVKPIDKIKLVSENKEFLLNLKDISLRYDQEATQKRAFQLTRTGNFIYDLNTKINILVNGKRLGLVANYDQEKLNDFISQISDIVSVDPINIDVNLDNNKLNLTKGTSGKVLNRSLLLSKISHQIAFSDSSDIILPIEIVEPILSTDQIEKLKLKVERDPQNPKFVFSDGKVTEFSPALDGIKIDIKKLNELTKNGNLSFDIPIIKTPPEITTDKINNLGIKELIGMGTSTYFHSIPGRVHNVNLAASRINGTLVAPNETFSFNKTLGDVSKLTGYKAAYVISEGRTILGDGGGVCQVSSALFRAVLNAGLPVDERTAHAYRVGYYEQGSPPGFDATVYAPSPDFKFTNDTDKYILIVSKNDPKNYSLNFELYGTSDGRVATVSKPVVSNVSAPLPDVYQDDPTLPLGTIKQVDYKASGARVSFNYLVTRDGQDLFKKTFVSNYRPWASVFMRGTKTQ